MSRFVMAARVGEIPPGRMKRVDAGTRRILLANVGGHFYAVDDTCTHEDASLSSGALRGEWVKCPLHGSRFNVRTGEVMEEPATANLGTYPVRVEAGEVWIGTPP
jgi:3-phenylpropionate/trans-cinnamate dioxygenase ferredoxin subunit